MRIAKEACKQSLLETTGHLLLCVTDPDQEESSAALFTESCEINRLLAAISTIVTYFNNIIPLFAIPTYSNII